MVALEQDTLTVEPYLDAHLSSNINTDKKGFPSVTPIQVKIESRKSRLRTKSANELKYVDAS